MALTTLPGQSQGYKATRYSSYNKRALGKLTDSNHISQLHMGQPANYDKRIISLYTQTSLYANDFLQMVNKTTPYEINTASEYFRWDVCVPYQFTTLLQIPDSTDTLTNIGINHQPFEVVFDKAEFYINDVITANKMYGQQFIVLADPLQQGTAWRYTLQLMSENPKTTSVDRQWLQEGKEYQFLYNLIGEWDQKLSGLGNLGDKITLYQKLSSGNGIEHTTTGWADVKFKNATQSPTDLDPEGHPLDLVVYEKKVRNADGTSKIVRAWEPFIEVEMKKKMLEMKVGKMVWAQGASSQTGGGKHELKTASMGVYPQMRKFGNLEQYNDGQFSINIIRNVFGDLFYRRVDEKNRHVHMFTNEAGFEVFKTAAKDDLLKAGLTIIADDRFIQGSGQHMTISWAFDKMVTSDTGLIELSHLMELDLPQTNSEFGRNKKSTPVFMVFDVAGKNGEGFGGQVREVRMKGEPSMTWGYIDGTFHHLGFEHSKGMNSANMFPGYKVWMKDRYDVFLEDPTRCVLIEQIPQF